MLQSCRKERNNIYQIHSNNINYITPPLKNVSRQLASLFKSNCILAEIIPENQNPLGWWVY